MSSVIMLVFVILDWGLKPNIVDIDIVLSILVLPYNLRF